MQENSGASVGGRHFSTGVARRTVLIGGAAVVGGVVFNTGEAVASPNRSWTPARVQGRATQHAINVVTLDTHQALIVSLDRDTITHADLSAGQEILIEGGKSGDGSLAARRIVRGVFGEFADVKR
jgi:hypothetical protein